MKHSFSSVIALLLLSATLTGCDALFEIFSPNEPPAPAPPVASEAFPVVLEFEDTTDVAFYIAPHASITDAQWRNAFDCDLAAEGDCDPDALLPIIQLDLFNDGNADLTRVVGNAFVYDRNDELITQLIWQRDAFQEKDGQVNVWQMRETVQVEIAVQDLCVDITRAVCSPQTFTPRNVGRVYIELEIVGVSPL